MTDISVTAHVTRATGGNLSINDHTTYTLAGPQILGGNVSWDRQQVNAPWVDGDITVARRRTNVTESVVIYVKSDTQTNLDSAIDTLVKAFTQDRFTLQIAINGKTYQWDCEAADYQIQFDTTHVWNKYVVCTFNVPRKPVALAGSF